MLTSSLSCQAGINVHTTMGTFTPAAEAAGTLDFTENLDSGSKVGSIITLTDVSITGNDIAFFPNGNDTNKVDGTGYLRFRVDNSSTLTFTFNAPVTAFGFEVNPRVQGVNDVLLVNIDGVDSSIAMPTTDTTEFRGLVSTTPFTSVMFSNSGSADDFYGIDNLIAYAVPEPSAYACITGILMFSCVLLRRQRPR
ncbi:MAG: hypothetical protein ABF322_04710 [Lentimonas sp.]